jgi:Holliday junction resolvase RusA-like endonuclease
MSHLSMSENFQQELPAHAATSTQATVEGISSNARAPLSVTFVVPGQPQGKGRPRVGKIGAHARMFTPAKTVAYEGLIAHEARVAMAGGPLMAGACACRVAIDCQVPASWSGKKQRMALAGEVFPTTKPDADNVLKAIFDGCNGVVFKDDVQVIDVNVRKRYSATPGVRVFIVGIE